ncbi:MAG: hypothetical protein OSA97_05810 [Nevskia sp.]|nr:hypothetical protein [Nevskia sp.]
MKVQYLGHHCDVRWGFYRNGKLALQLFTSGEDPDTPPGMPVATPTINTEHRIDADEIVVKDYFENEGMVRALIEAGVIRREYTLLYVGPDCPCGRCRLTDAARIEAYGLKQPT